MVSHIFNYKKYLILECEFWNGGHVYGHVQSVWPINKLYLGEFKSPLCYQITTLLVIHSFYFDRPLDHDFTGLEGDSTVFSLLPIHSNYPTWFGCCPRMCPRKIQLDSESLCGSEENLNSTKSLSSMSWYLRSIASVLCPTCFITR